MKIDIACAPTPKCHILIDGKPLDRIYLTQAYGASMLDSGTDSKLDLWNVFVDDEFIAQVPKLNITFQAKVWLKLLEI